MGYFKKHLLLLLLLTIGITAFIRGILFLDPDFGWHLRMGELILQKGIPLTDPFSYTMPSYAFIDHEWLTNVLISIGYKSIGIYGLALIFALIFVLALFLAVPKKFKNYSALPLALSGGLMLGFTGIRTQVVTWFFLALLFKLMFDEKIWKKWRFFIPLVFILWANLHAGFAVGIALLGLVFVFRAFQKKQINVPDLIIVITSFLVTFINPYGIGIWHEVWMVASDNFARWNIAEWVPGVFDTDIALLILFALSFSFLLRYKAKIGGLRILIYLFLLLMAISSLRHIPLWAISAIPVTSVAIKLLIDEVQQNKYAVARLKKLTKILFAVVFFIFVFEAAINLVGSYNFSEQKYYPVKSVAFLSRQNLSGNLFTLYNYGGYLIWKLPNKKVFIDGRMPSWRRTGTFPNEANYAFKDYLRMLDDKNYFKQMLQKYNVDYVLLPVQPSNTQKPAFVVKLRELVQKLTLFKTNVRVINEDLVKLGLKKIYNDGRFVIYKN